MRANESRFGGVISKTSGELAACWKFIRNRSIILSDSLDVMEADSDPVYLSVKYA
jgi:hypothetical protein